MILVPLPLLPPLLHPILPLRFTIHNFNRLIMMNLPYQRFSSSPAAIFTFFL
jgi:hypothetical protein